MHLFVTKKDAYSPCLFHRGNKKWPYMLVQFYQGKIWLICSYRKSLYENRFYFCFFIHFTSFYFSIICLHILSVDAEVWS